FFLEALDLPVAGLDRRTEDDAALQNLLRDAVIKDPRPVRVDEVEVLDLVEPGVDRAGDRLGGEAVGGGLLADLMRLRHGGGHLLDAERGAAGVRPPRPSTAGHDLDEVRAVLEQAAGRRAHAVDTVRLFVAPPEMTAGH